MPSLFHSELSRRNVMGNPSHPTSSLWNSLTASRSTLLFRLPTTASTQLNTRHDTQYNGSAYRRQHPPSLMKQWAPLLYPRERTYQQTGRNPRLLREKNATKGLQVILLHQLVLLSTTFLNSKVTKAAKPFPALLFNLLDRFGDRQS